MASANAEKKVVEIANDRIPESDPDISEAANSDISVCKLCFGTGTWLKPGAGAIVCECRRSNSRTSLLNAARIPPRFQGCSLAKYEVLHTSQGHARTFAHRLVNEYPAVETGLLFMGPVGVGKTHLAVAILIDLIEKKGVPGLFYESGALLKAIQESYSPISQTSEMRVLAPVYQADVLVLDELGSSVSTDWVRDTLYQIINTRYNNRKTTIFTTNYLDELYVEHEVKNLKSRLDELNYGEFTRDKAAEAKQIEKRLKTLMETQLLEDRIGTRLRSRLYEMCTKVVIKGEDYRKTLETRH